MRACEYRAGYFGLGLVGPALDQIRLEIEDFRPDPQKCSGPRGLSRVKGTSFIAARETNSSMQLGPSFGFHTTLFYAIVPAGQTSGFRAGFRPDSRIKASKSALRPRQRGVLGKAPGWLRPCAFISAELPHSLKVSDRRRNTPKSAQNRSESLCAG